MGKAVEKVEREMAVLKADCGWTPDGDGSLLEAAERYIDALESLLVDTVERQENRPAPVADPYPGEVIGTATPKHRKTDPAASRKADLQNLPVRDSQRWKVLRYLSSLTSGKTASEIAEGTGIPLNSISTRMSELVQGGWAEVRGERHGKSVYVPAGRARQQFGQESSLLG
jgi:hypothetical protein